jgi:alcohol dehydrogenase
VKPFEHASRIRLVCGPGTLSRLGELARELGFRRTLVVSDPGIVRAGYAARASAALETAGVTPILFSGFDHDPTSAMVEAGVAAARAAEVDSLVGLGGGSSMDCAKSIGFLLASGGHMPDYKGYAKAKQPLPPMIGVPTTAGTGSEAQSYALIADARTHMKMACGDPKAACRIAVLDPELTLSMPAPVTAATGVDALSHAVESYVATCSNPVSQLFSRQAWQLLVHGFPAVLADPGDTDARARMLLGAHLAGAAIENSMLGATHALANPLSARFGTTHGVAIGVMLPHVIRYNRESVGRRYAELAVDAGLCAANDQGAEDRLADHVASLAAEARLPTRLTECGVDASLFESLAAEAAQQWTGRFNPRPVDELSLRRLYEGAL